MNRKMNAASRMTPTTIASTGTSREDLTGSRPRPPPLVVFRFLAARIACLERAWAVIGELVEYRPDLSGLGRPLARPLDRGLNPQEGGPLRDYEILYIVRPDLEDDKVQDIVKRVNSLISR